MWTIRQRATRVETTLSAEALRDRLFNNEFGSGYEFRAPGATAWVDRRTALERLLSGSGGGGERASAPPASEPRGGTARPSPTVPPTRPTSSPSPTSSAPARPTPPLPPPPPRGRLDRPLPPPPAPRSSGPPRAPSPPAQTPSPRHSEPMLAPAVRPQAESKVSEPLATPAGGPLASSTAVDRGVADSDAGGSGAVHSIRNRCARAPEDIEADLDMTPMIDVVFQLLIFFMVASSISVMGELALPPAVTGDTEDVRDRVTLVLDLPPSIAESLPERGGVPMLLSEAVLYFSDEPERKLDGARLREEMQAKFAAHRAGRTSGDDAAPASVQLILMAHRRAPVRLVRQVLSQAREVGAGEALVGVAMRVGAPQGGAAP